MPVSSGGGSGASLAGDATAQADATGALTTEIALGGAALVVAGADGTLSTSINMVGGAIVTADANGDLHAEIHFSGAAIAQAAAAGDLVVGNTLSGGATAQAGASGDLSTGKTLSGAAQALASGQGDLSVQITMSGAALAQALATGDLDIGDNSLAGHAQATAAGGQAAAQGFYDDLEGGDGDYLESRTGWELVAGGAPGAAQINANGEIKTTGTGLYLAPNQGTVNHETIVTLANVTAFGDVPIASIAATDAGNQIVAYVNMTFGWYTVSVIQAGVPTGIGLGGVPAAGDSVRLGRFQGKVYLYVNDVLAFEPVAESFNAAATRQGFFADGTHAGDPIIRDIRTRPVAGELATAITLAGAAIGTADAHGGLSTELRLKGAAASVSTGSGALSTSLTLHGDAVATALTGGDLVAHITFSGAAVARAAANGNLFSEKYVAAPGERSVTVWPESRTVDVLEEDRMVAV